MALEPPAAADASLAVLPVEIVPTANEPHPRARRSGTIEITLAGGARASAVRCHSRRCGK